MAKTIHEKSVDTQTLERVLLEVEIGQTISYKTLSAAIGVDVQRRGRGYLNSARVGVHRSHNYVFACIPNVGLKRMDDRSKVAFGAVSGRKIRNAARRGLKVVTAIDSWDNLPSESKLKHNLYAAQLGVIAHVTKPGAVKKLEKVATPERTLPLASALEEMRKTC